MILDLSANELQMFLWGVCIVFWDLDSTSFIAYKNRKTKPLLFDKTWNLNFCYACRRKESEWHLDLLFNFLS